MRYKTLISLCIINLAISLTFSNPDRMFNFDKKIIFSSKDSFVTSTFPYNNYGQWERMYCGNSISTAIPRLQIFMSYLSFEINSLTRGWEKVFLSLTINIVYKPFNIELGIVHEYWNESLITWLNRPLNITWTENSLYLETDGTFIFDITELISPSIGELNIILYDYQIEDKMNVLITTKEDSVRKLRPQLIFDYPENLTGLISNQTLLSFTLMCCAFIGFLYFFVKIQERKKRTSL